jgi:hypothetical protein
MLATAASGDVYCTMTLPNYWTDRNLGSNGRFLTMNKHMARKGVIIKRLFLVTVPFQSLPEEEKLVLEWQHRALSALAEESKVSALGRHPNEIRFDIQIAVVKEDAVASFEQSGSLVCYLWTRPPGTASLAPSSRGDIEKTVCLNFHSISRTEWIYNRPAVSRQIQKLRYWSPRRAEARFLRSTAVLEGHWQGAISLEHYIRSTSDVLSDPSYTNSFGRGIDLLGELIKPDP